MAHLNGQKALLNPDPCQEMLRGAFIPRNLSVGNLAHHKQLLAGKLNLRLLEWKTGKQILGRNPLQTILLDGGCWMARSRAEQADIGLASKTQAPERNCRWEHRNHWVRLVQNSSETLGGKEPKAKFRIRSSSRPGMLAGKTD